MRGALLTLKNGSVGLAIVERIADMFAPQTPWAQRLWRPSAIDALRHSLGLIDGGARPAAKKYAIQMARESLAGDLFIPSHDRGGLLKSLSLDPEKMIPSSVTHARLKSICIELEQEYPKWLQRYLDAFEDDERVSASKVDGDTLAWQLAAYLRSAGMSDKWIANFCNYAIKHNPIEERLSDVMRRALLAAAGDVGWTFLIPLAQRRSFNENAPPVLSRQEFQRRFEFLFPGKSVPEHRGGVEVRVETVDKHAAIELVQIELQRLSDRHRASMTKRRIAFSSEAWVSPGAWSTSIKPEARNRLEVRQLDVAGGAVLFARASDELEAALDLLIAAERTSSRAATIAAWGVLETLFADESDYGSLAAVADRAADVLACLYVRDALRSVSKAHSRSGTDDLAEQLRNSSEQAAAVLIEQGLPTMAPSSNTTLGELARRRAARLSAGEVEAVRSQLTGVLRRFYDLRNQIVHAGRMSPFGLQRTYEESIVLLSALVDELLTQDRDGRRTAREVAGRAAWLIERLRSGRATPATLAEISQF